MNLELSYALFDNHEMQVVNFTLYNNAGDVNMCKCLILHSVKQCHLNPIKDIYSVRF